MHRTLVARIAVLILIGCWALSSGGQEAERITPKEVPPERRTSKPTGRFTPTASTSR